MIALVQPTQRVKRRGNANISDSHSLRITPVLGQRAAHRLRRLVASLHRTSVRPLSALGLMNSLYTGLSDAETVRRYVNGSVNALDTWIQQIDEIALADRTNLRHYYAMEQHWSEQLFWQRRIAKNQ